MSSYKRWVIYVASAFLVLAAALTGQPQMYFMAAIILCLPWVSYLLGMLALRNLEFDRETPGSGWDGDTVEFHLVVTSRSRTARLCLEAEDHLPEWLKAEDEETILFNAAPNTITRVPYRVRLGKRGVYRLEWLTIIAQDPLGI